jgi:hypothetical protein
MRARDIVEDAKFIFYQMERFCRCCGMTLRISPAGKNTKGNVN